MGDLETPESRPFHVIKDGVLDELPSDGEGGYMISVPALAGRMTVGGSLDEAMAMIADAMEGWLAVAREMGAQIPPEFEHLAQGSYCPGNCHRFRLTALCVPWSVAA